MRTLSLAHTMTSSGVPQRTLLPERNLIAQEGQRKILGTELCTTQHATTLPVQSRRPRHTDE